MPQLAFGASAYKREYGAFPELRLINLYAEPSPTAEGGVALQARLGLTSHATRGSGPINGIFSETGLFSSSIFAISGSSFYRDATLLGSVLGSLPASGAFSNTELVLTRGVAAYSYDGADFAAITLPGGWNAVAVEYIASRFLFVRENSHRVYFSNLEDGRTVESLDFFSAELTPDYLIDIKAAGGKVYLIGQSSIEPWYPGPNADLPFIRIDQGLISVGAKGPGCTTKLGDDIFFIGSDNKAYLLRDGIRIVSHFGIEERIKGSTTHSVFAYHHEGHRNFCIRLDDETLAFDIVTENWWQADTKDHGNWRARNATNLGAIPYFGDDTNGTIWRFGTTFIDGVTPLEGLFTLLKSITNGTEAFDSLQLVANTGHTVPLSGDDANPIIELQTSHDGGNTMGNWRSSSMGPQGEYRTRARWRRLGTYSSPGFYAHVRITDQSPRRFSLATYNEMGGGRSR